MQRGGSTTQQRPRTGYGRRTSAHLISGVTNPQQIQREDSSVSYTDLASPQATPRQLLTRKPGTPFSPRGNLITLNTSSLIPKSAPRAKAKVPSSRQNASSQNVHLRRQNTFEKSKSGALSERGDVEYGSNQVLPSSDSQPLEAQGTVYQNKENTQNRPLVRPKSSYGRRSTPASSVRRDPVVYSTEPEPERPVTARGHRTEDGPYHDTLVNERPTQQELLQSAHFAAQEGDSRPKTGRGRRSASFHSVPQVDVAGPIERPKTRRGNRILRSPAGDPWSTSTLYKSLDGSISDSEKFSFVAGPSLEDNTVHSQAPGEVDILRLDTGAELVEELDEELNTNNNAGTEDIDSRRMYDVTERQDIGVYQSLTKQPYHSMKSRKSFSNNLPQENQLYSPRPPSSEQVSLPRSPSSGLSSPMLHTGPFVPSGPPPGQPKRPRSSRYRRISKDYADQVRSPAFSRSSTPDSVSSYSVLPPIGSSSSHSNGTKPPLILPSSADSNDEDDKTADTVVPDMSSLKITDTGPPLSSPPESETCADEDTFSTLRRTITLPVGPSDGEKRILIGVKLPSGQRVQRYFFLNDRLMTVLNFAEVSARLDFTGCQLVSTVPRVIFSDMSVSLQDAKLVNRMLLHVEVQDEDDKLLNNN